MIAKGSPRVRRERGGTFRATIERPADERKKEREAMAKSRAEDPNETREPVPTVSVAEADRRARRSNEQAGLYLPPFARALRERVVRGEMTEAEYRAEVIAHYSEREPRSDRD